MDRLLLNRLLPAVLLLLTIALPASATDYFSVAEVQQALFPDATQFVDKQLSFTDDQRDEIKKLAKTRQRDDSQKVWRAEKDGELLGWVFVDDVIGKHEFITYALAVSPQGQVQGLEIMNYRETHGDEVREESWRSQFFGKTLENKLKLGKDIDNISGATLSCRNLTDGVRRLLVQWQLFLSKA